MQRDGVKIVRPSPQSTLDNHAKTGVIERPAWSVVIKAAKAQTGFIVADMRSLVKATFQQASLEAKRFQPLSRNSRFPAAHVRIVGQQSCAYVRRYHVIEVVEQKSDLPTILEREKADRPKISLAKMSKAKQPEFPWQKLDFGADSLGFHP
jgi:hypothetical protein